LLQQEESTLQSKRHHRGRNNNLYLI